MGATRGQTAAAAGAFDAQTAVERLESEMADLRTDVTELKKSTSVIADIQKNMVTVSALDALMQKYLAPPMSPTSTAQVIPMEGNLQSRDASTSTHPTIPPPAPVIWSAAPTLESVSKSAPQGQNVGYTAVMTDSINCTTTRSYDPGQIQYSTRSNGLHVPSHFQIPPINQPPPQTFEQQTHPPHPGIWPQVQLGQPQQFVPPNYNPVTGQFLRFMTTQRLTDGIQHKLLLKLLEFDYTIEYKKGKENIAADALSRRDTQCYPITVCVPEWLEDVKLSYIQDKDSGKLLQKIAKDVSDPPQYTIKEGIIRHGSKIYVGASTNMRLQLLENFHQSGFGGHSGTKATYQRIKRVFCWPHLKQMVQKFVAECPVCQLVKVEHVHPAGLLKPLDIPDIPWSCISMDFIEALPNSNGKEVILVVIDRLTKYAHFIALSHPYTVEQIVAVFMDNIVRLHGFPKEIISDRDRIFTSTLYQQIFKAFKVTLKFSTAYHPQTDGQTERVNQCLESYLRSMVFQEPKQWSKWLAMAEWWYNTSYHSSLKMTPFEALYQYSAPMIAEPDRSASLCPAAQLTVTERDDRLKQLKANLQSAQNRMKLYADKLRTERHFKVGDMVYLKIQPYRQNAFGLRGSLKLRSKYYGPFMVLEKVGDLAYKLHLPDDAMIHPVFHVSQLKAHLGKHAVPLPNVPLVTDDGKIKTTPFALLDERIIQRKKTPVKQWLIHWESLGPEDATWEDLTFIKKIFPQFQP